MVSILKKIAVMTISAGTGNFYVEQLKGFFGDAISAKSYNMENGGFADMEICDLYVVGATSDDIFDFAMSCIPDGAQVVISNVTVTKDTVDRLKKIPKGTKALLVNMSHNMAAETIADLYRLGINNVSFVPIGPGDAAPSDITLAITPGEACHVPPTALEIIDIGNRVFTANTILEIALKLGFSQFIESEAYKRTVAQLASTDYGLDRLGSLALDLESKLETLLDTIQVGVIGIDMNNVVFAMNHVAEEVTGEKKEKVIGKTTDQCLGCMPINVYKDNMAKNETRLITVKGAPVSLSTMPIVQKDRFLGYFAIVQSFKDEEEKQRKLRLQLMNRGYKAKYTFDDIIGECPQMVTAKTVAKKMARSAASVLIYGESGTGKELFAHAIHNYSQRAEMPFIAINCAALPDALLESELFGYAEGSFTGAKKGGKPGLFEHAHKGTLFLDEIEGMSPNLQIKLLRVLQEKEIIRVGDDRIINVDVRIVAASNENIKQMVADGSFRKDLYYRLNALPIDIPPLRQRGRDVFLLTEHIKREIGATFTLDDSAKRAFSEYCWDGNIRELRNVIEYLNYTGSPVISFQELPAVFHEQENSIYSLQDTSGGGKTLEQLFLKKSGVYQFILQQLYIAKKQNRQMGRKSLSLLSEEQGMPLSEQEIRTILQNLEKEGLVFISRGRAGTSITSRGEQMLKKC